jgi:hypothetical protein
MPSFLQFCIDTLHNHKIHAHQGDFNGVKGVLYGSSTIHQELEIGSSKANHFVL